MAFPLWGRVAFARAGQMVALQGGQIGSSAPIAQVADIQRKVLLDHELLVMARGIVIGLGI